MSIGAENVRCFENMWFGNNNNPFAISGSSQDCFLGSVMGIEDSNLWKNQEIMVLDQHNSTTHHQFQYHQPVDYCGNNNLASSTATSVSCSGSLPLDIMQRFNSDLEKQRLEMDWLLQLKNKRLRRLLLEEQINQQALLMNKLQSRINILIQQKDQELAVAITKILELQHLLRTQEIESQIWQKRSNESEAMLFDLNNRLNQLKENHAAKEHGDEDTVAFCDSSSSYAEQEQQHGEENKEKIMVCKLCQARRSCVVLFPCRDLCCCKHCEPLLQQFCPVCGTVKEATLEVFFV